MAWNDPDPYYQPEKFGLTKLHEIDDPGASYSFDMIVLWRHDETGALYYAQDSGCSCPSPFEGFTSLGKLVSLTDDTWGEFEATVNDWCTYSPRHEAAAQVDRTEMLRVAANALRGK